MKREKITAQEFANRFDVCVARDKDGIWKYYEGIPVTNEQGWDGVGVTIKLHEITDNIPWKHSLTLPIRLQNVGQRVSQVKEIITAYGCIDGGHHKQWLLDQVIRILTGDEYAQWVEDYQDGVEGPNTYEWDEGIAPLNDKIIGL
jgi:hypothetical protein